MWYTPQVIGNLESKRDEPADLGGSLCLDSYTLGDEHPSFQRF